MKKHLILSMAMVVGGGLSGQAFANQGISNQTGVANCNICHTDIGTGALKPAAASAYGANHDIPALKAWAKAQSAPPINTKPIITMRTEWDAEVGKELVIPLTISQDNDEQDTVKPSAKPTLTDATFSDEYVGGSGLPTFDYKWTPAATDKAVGKVVTVTFVVQETDTTKKLKSKPVKAKIRVWPAGGVTDAPVQKLMVSTAKWADGKLNLKGKVTLYNMMTPAEKDAFLNGMGYTLHITQGKDGKGSDIAAAQPITFDSKGNWTVTDLPLMAPFSCNLTVDLDEASIPATRAIAGAKGVCAN